MTKSSYSHVTAILVLASVGCTFAADLPKEGTYDINTCFTRNSTRVDYSQTHFAYSYGETGTSVSSPPGGLFDNEEISCVGMVASFDGKRTGGSICVGVAKDGDKRITQFRYDSENKLVRETVGGTGKYDGLVSNGTYQAVGPSVEIKTGTAQKICNHQTGTYKLK